MRSLSVYGSLVFAFTCAALARPCFATDYSEAISGDFSNSGLTPTSIGTLTLGSNTITGTTGRGANGMDRDYFTVTVPTGSLWTSLTELPGTASGGSVSFIGIQAGNQVTVNPNAFSAAGLLGWTHYGPNDINADILPCMSVPSLGSSGFTTPLGAGSYSIWIQDFNTGSFAYGFRFGVQAAVPEANSIGLLFSSGLFGTGIYLRRRQRKG